MQRNQLRNACVRGGAFLGLFLAGLLCLHAADGARYDGPEWNLLDLKQVCTAAADVTLKKYPDCDEASVDKKMVRVYRADGTGEAQDEAFVKILTEKGKRGNRALAFSFLL